MSEQEPKKSMGQHWLHDKGVLQAMCQAAEVEQGDVVLEIGPGTGTLTDVLLEQGAKVTALEFDQDLAQQLEVKYTSQPDIKIVEGDIRTYDFGGLVRDYKIVANIPYYLTANLLRQLTSSNTHKPSVAALLMQREVAERATAEPGRMAILSVAVQFYYEATLGQVVPAALFTPPPKVDSQILILHQRPKQLFDVEPKQFFRLVKAGFSQRRKTLVNSLSGGLQIDRGLATELLESSRVPALARAQSLSLDDWHRLYQLATPLLHFK